MPHRVVDIGNCALDHSAIRRMVERAIGAEVIQAHGWHDGHSAARDGADLVLVNRVLDRDGGDGLNVIRQLKADPQTRQIPVMLVSNFPHYQQQAQQLGAQPGFGKATLEAPETLERLRQALATGARPQHERP